jgi:hypothetical protein
VWRLRERHAMLGLIFEVLVDVPFKACLAHGTRLADEAAKHQVKIWLYIWLCLLTCRRERQPSAAAGSASDVGADAGGSQLQGNDPYGSPASASRGGMLGRAPATTAGEETAGDSPRTSIPGIGASTCTRAALCAHAGLPGVLGHALAMPASHGGHSRWTSQPVAPPHLARPGKRSPFRHALAEDGPRPPLRVESAAHQGQPARPSLCPWRWSLPTCVVPPHADGTSSPDIQSAPALARPPRQAQTSNTHRLY